jgi:acetyl esterase/lipase
MTSRQVPRDKNPAIRIPFNDEGTRYYEDEMYTHVTENDSVPDVVTSPAFDGFGRFIFPGETDKLNKNMQLNNISSLLPLHNHIIPGVTVRVINHMIDDINRGKTIFYDYYTEPEKLEDPARKSTGLFFFRGRPGAPCAIICPGGGFAYVGSIHEGFPYGVELCNKGYNAFVLQYRTGDEIRATEDLAAAISYIFKNAESFGISTRDYSIWGSSAGARMVARIGTEGVAAYGGADLPKPSAIIMAYTGHPAFSKDDPATFVIISEDDTIVRVPVVDERVENLKNAGVDVEYHKYKHSGHGFGLGPGTDAEGWVENAIRFWEKHISR